MPGLLVKHTVHYSPQKRNLNRSKKNKALSDMQRQQILEQNSHQTPQIQNSIPNTIKQESPVDYRKRTEALWFSKKQHTLV